MIKKLFAFIFVCIITFATSISAFAATNWNSSSSSYAPSSGTVYTTYNYSSSQGGYIVNTTAYFYLSSSNVSTITAYNLGQIIPDTPWYFGLDIKNIPAGTERMHASSTNYLYTNFPNPVKDVEDDNGDGKNEESEVVALGTMNNTTQYYMHTVWLDTRTGASSDIGQFAYTFHMSSQDFPWGDYNTRVYDRVHDVYYGANQGQA